jgi:hypothetical protein
LSFFFLFKDPLSKKLKPVLKSHIFIRITFNKNGNNNNNNNSSVSFFTPEIKTSDYYEKNNEDQFFSTNNLVNNKLQSYLNKKSKNKHVQIPCINCASPISNNSNNNNNNNNNLSNEDVVVLECILLAPVYQNIIDKFIIIYIPTIMYCTDF